MTRTDALDRSALASATTYMGVVAWPTILFALGAGGAWIATVLLALTGLIPLMLAVPLAAVLTYANYTVLHEAVHGSIAGTQRSLRWLNEALGYVAAWILMMPLTAHRHEHVAHHRHTNKVSEDPDFHVAEMNQSLPAAVRAALRAYTTQFSYYFEKRWAHAPVKQNVILCAEIVAALGPRVAVIAAGYWVEGLALFVVAWLLGATILLYLFAYLVHHPDARQGRYVDTATIIPPRLLRAPLTWLWLFQNYHSIHHLFPRVPFYSYARLYGDIENIMVARGAPVYRMSLRGLEPSEVKLAAQPPGAK